MRANYTDFNDAEHVRRTLGGDKSAFDALVRQYHGMVFSVALARLDHDYDQADELTQEVFLRAWLHLDRLLKPDYFPAWLVQITRNLAADWKRRDRRQSALVQMLAADHPEVLTAPAMGLTPREAVAAADEANELNRSLKQLPPEYRELLLLHYGEGISQSGIARNLGVSPSTIMRRLEKALNNLRQVYNRDGGQELARAGQVSKHRASRTLAVIAAAFLLTPHQKSALAAAAGPATFLPRLFPLKKLAAVASAGVAAAAVMVLIGNWERPALLKSGNTQQENSTRFFHRSVEVRSVDGGAEDPADSKTGMSSRNSRHLLKSATAGEHATPKGQAAINVKQDDESRQKLASASATNAQAGAGAVASASTGPSSSGCPSLEEMVERIRKMETIAGSVHFTYRSAVTVMNEDNQPEIRDREGTVTVKNGRYLIKVSDGADHSQMIFYSPARQELAAVVNPERQSGPDQHTINIWKSPSHITAQIQTYNPLAGLIRPPYGSGSLSDFIAKNAQQGAVSVKCSPDTTHSVAVVSTDWALRFQPEQFPFFDQMKHRPEAAHGQMLDRTVAEFSSLNGVVYPSVFYTSYSDNGRFGGFENATTTTLTLLKLGDEVPRIEDPFVRLRNARRFEMESGNFVTGAGEKAGQGPVENASAVTTASEPNLAQKFHDPQVAQQYPQPGMLTGQVVDPEGRPVPEVTIYFTSLSQAAPANARSQNLQQRFALAQPVQQAGRTYTDSGGNFVINSPTTGVVALATDHLPYARTFQVADLPTTGFIITLPLKGAEIQGTVRDIATGDPVSDADVMLLPQTKVPFWTGDRHGTQTFTLVSGSYGMAKTDNTGRYYDSRMPPGDFLPEAGTDTLIPVNTKYVSFDPPKLVAGQLTRVPDIYVYPGYTLKGYIKDSRTGNPIPGATVGPSTSSGFSPGKRPQPVTTDANGYYEITRLQPLGGDVRRDGNPPRLTFEYISAKADGYKSDKFAPRIDGRFDPQNLVIEHDFELTPGTEPEQPTGNLQRFEMPRL